MTAGRTLEQLEEAGAQRPGGLRAAAARSASVAGVVNIVVQLVLFVVYLVLARLAAPSVFGVFAAGSILLSFGEIFTESGMTAALLQRRGDVDEAATTALASTVIGGLLLALVALALSPLVGLYFHSHETGLVAAALSGYLVINGVTGVPGTLLQRRFAVRRWLLEPVATLLFGLTAGLGLASGLGAWALVIGWYVQTAFRAAAFWTLLRWKPDPHLVSFRMWRDLARYARHILVSILIGEAQRVATTAIVGRRLGPADLGRFRFGFRLATQANAPLLAANAYTIQPTLVRLSLTPERVRSAVLTSFRIVCLIGFPLGAVFIPLGNEIAVLLLGEQWRATGPILVALAPMTMAAAATSVANEVFKATGHPQMLPRFHLLWTVTTIGLLFALIGHGGRGAAWAWSASTVLVALYTLNAVPRAAEVGRRDLVRAIAPPLAAALVAAAAVSGVDRLVFGGTPHADAATLLRLAVDVAIGLALYVALVLAVARQAVSEFVHAVRAITGHRAQAAIVDA